MAMFAAVQAAQSAVVTYNVIETFYEPQTQPNDSIFTGTFNFDTDAMTVSDLSGTLTESMTGGMGGMGGMGDMGGTMNELMLTYQLSSVYDPGLGGLLVTTFLNDSTDTLYAGLGGDGWAPGSGMGMYYDFPNANPGNAYAMIFVNTTDPTAPLTQAQIDKLAYADCAPGGMMGSVCMTGTTVAGYGTVGTMGGYPVSQVITEATVSAVPLPAAYVLMMSGMGLLGFMSRRRTAALTPA